MSNVKKPFTDGNDDRWSCQWTVPEGTDLTQIVRVLGLMDAEKYDTPKGALRCRLKGAKPLNAGTFDFIQDLFDGKAQAYFTEKPFHNRFELLGELGSITHRLGMGNNYLALTPHHDMPLCIVVRTETDEQKGAIAALLKSFDVPPQKDRPGDEVTAPNPKGTRRQPGRGRGGDAAEPDAGA